MTNLRHVSIQSRSGHSRSDHVVVIKLVPAIGAGVSSINWLRSSTISHSNARRLPAVIRYLEVPTPRRISLTRATQCFIGIPRDLPPHIICITWTYRFNIWYLYNNCRYISIFLHNIICIKASGSRLDYVKYIPWILFRGWHLL